MKGKNNNEILNSQAVYNTKVFEAENLKSTTIEDIFNITRTSELLKNQTDILRSIQDEDEQKEYKKQNLPYFNLGTFNNNHRKNANLKSSSFFLFDYDDLDDKLDSLKARLNNDDSVFAYFVSPRGNGLKVIYRLENEITNPAFFSQLYKYYATEFKIDLGSDPDKTSDPSRPCFFSYDPEIFYNPDAKPLNIDVISPIVAANPLVKSLDLTYSPVDNVLLRQAVEFLRQQKLSYNDWVACGFALAPLGEYGRQYFKLLSNNPHYNDTPVEIESKFKNFLANPDKFNNIDSLYLIAVNYGFEVMSFGQTEVKADAVPFDKELEEQFLLDDTRDPNKLLGFPLTRFNELAGHVDGLQPGFYLLGAESNIGKTAVLTNMCLDVLETNPDVSVMYFSLDDSRKYTAYRFLSIMTQLSINDTHKQQTDPVKANVLMDGRKNLIDLARSGRLIVKDTSEIYKAEQLVAEIKGYQDKSNLVVFIDGLYNLEVGDKFRGGIREENIERARQVKQLVDTYRIPILTTGELRKKTKEDGKDKAPTVHDLMETGKFAYNANVVWLLYGKAEDLKSDEPVLTLEYVKNKLSDYKGIQYLTFKRATGTMNEVPAFLQVLPTNGPLFNAGGGLD
jgi:hypothetical protein